MNFLGPLTDGDYTIFQWRQNGNSDPPTIYLRDPSEPLPSQSSYRNPSFYLFHPDYSAPAQTSPQPSTPSPRSKKSNTPNGVAPKPKHKKEFEDFHTSNGVRTIVGTIGPIPNGAWAASSSGTYSRVLGFSAHAPQEWVSPCVHVPKVCHEAQLYPTRCVPRALRV